MERVLSAEEKIRRAEEIYERRRAQNYRNTTATVNVSGNNRDFRLLKKMIIQILICLLIYFIFYLIETTNYVFSATTINKTKEILEYDMDIKGIYTDIKSNFIKEENNNNIEQNLTTENNNEDDNVGVNNSSSNENIDVAEDNNSKETNNTDEKDTEEIQNKDMEENSEQIINEEIKEEEPITVAQEIKNNYSINKPTNGGFISSEFGTREPEGDIVTAYHHGIDIGVIVGTDVLSAIDGEVILATESESYGKYVKIRNGDLVTLYAHCSELLAKVGDTVKQGDKIALSGATGKVTGPHLHFEIIYKDEYINPREILEF